MSLWISKFKICLASAGVNMQRPLSELVIAEPTRAPYKPYAQIFGRNGQGHQLRGGFPTCSWIWDNLPQTDIDVLQGFEAQDVYITTETDTGARRAYLTFACYAQPLLLGDAERRVAYDEPSDGMRQQRPCTMEFFGLIEQ